MCSCRPLELQWPYNLPSDTTDDSEPRVYYDPNREEAAKFYCKDQNIYTGNGVVLVILFLSFFRKKGTNIFWKHNTDVYCKVEPDNYCSLYCDDFFVAHAQCLDGEWTGQPELGFWCYTEPTQYDGGKAETQTLQEKHFLLATNTIQYLQQS